MIDSIGNVERDGSMPSLAPRAIAVMRGGGGCGEVSVVAAIFSHGLALRQLVSAAASAASAGTSAASSARRRRAAGLNATYATRNRAGAAWAWRLASHSPPPAGREAADGPRDAPHQAPYRALVSAKARRLHGGAAVAVDEAAQLEARAAMAVATAALAAGAAKEREGPKTPRPVAVRTSAAEVAHPTPSVAPPWPLGCPIPPTAVATGEGPALGWARAAPGDGCLSLESAPLPPYGGATPCWNEQCDRLHDPMRRYAL